MLHLGLFAGIVESVEQFSKDSSSTKQQMNAAIVGLNFSISNISDRVEELDRVVKEQVQINQQVSLESSRLVEFSKKLNELVGKFRI